MDEYLDQFFSSSSWECCESDKSNEMLLSSIVVEEDESNSSPTYLTNSNPSMESLAAQDASSLVHDLDSDAQDDAKNSNTNLPNPMPDGSFQVENMGFPYDVNQLPLNCDSFHEDFETLSQISQQWPLQSLEDAVPSLSPYNIYDMGSNAYNLSGLGTTENGKQDLQNYPLPSFASAPQIAMPMSGLQPLPQAENLTTTSSGECKTGKPRMRARRGQATDPHSIAERLRREKIADRMKNLQELVPNSNKTDKASMLDEIIEYVKFLQLQVKALSTSRQGTQQAKGANGSLMSPPIGQGGDIYSNEIAIEQLVRLMESDGTKAMQHLQNKGLFLIPISLAEAISTEKESSSSSSSSPAHPPDSDDNGKKKAGSGDAGLVHNSRSSSSSSNSSNSSSSLLPEVKQEVKNSNSLLPEK